MTPVGRPPEDYPHEVESQISHMTHSQADQSLLPRRSKDADLWRGWTIQTSRDGRLFYHHAESRTSQWQMPRELSHVLGEWVRVGGHGSVEGEGHVDGAEVGGYWRNEVLEVSAWKDPRHTTNLFQAALDGNLFFLQLYTEVGGYLDAVDAKGRAALHYNCAGGSMQAVIHLLQSNASVDMPDHAGSTPLHWACRYGHTPIVRILLEANADPDVQNSLGDTSMHEAAALGHMQPLHWLVLAKANPLLQNREMKTPAEVAERSQASDAESLLREHERYSSWHLGGGGHDERSPRGASSEAARSSASAASRRRSPRTALPEFAGRGVVAGSGRAASAGASATDGDGGGGAASGSDSDPDAPPEPSLALVVVRAARPLLRGVQWLANRVLGERKAEDLGAPNKFSYDPRLGQWVPQRPSAEAERSDAEDSDMSVASGASFTEDDDLDDVDTSSGPATPTGPARLAKCEMAAVHSDGLAGP